MWPVLRLIFADKITWTEASTIMTLEDVEDMNRAFDVWYDAVNAAPSSDDDEE